MGSTFWFLSPSPLLPKEDGGWEGRRAILLGLGGSSYSLHTQVMVILILINVQYLQNVVFSFEKGLSGQNHALSDSRHPTEKFPRQVPTF